MPRLEIFGPVSAGDIVNALRTATYAGKLTFIRNSKNANDITGKAVSFVRFSATHNSFTSDEMSDLVDRLRPIVGIEVASTLNAWIEPVQKPPVAATVVEGATCT